MHKSLESWIAPAQYLSSTTHFRYYPISLRIRYACSVAVGFYTLLPNTNSFYSHNTPSFLHHISVNYAQAKLRLILLICVQKKAHFFSPNIMATFKIQVIITKGLSRLLQPSGLTQQLRDGSKLAGIRVEILTGTQYPEDFVSPSGNYWAWRQNRTRVFRFAIHNHPSHSMS